MRRVRKGWLIGFIALCLFGGLLGGFAASAAQPRGGKRSASPSKEPSDEILQLREEIRRLKVLLKETLQALADHTGADDTDDAAKKARREKLEALLKQLEKNLEEEKKRKGETYSDTTREVNRLKQKIENIKSDLKELTGGIEFSGFFDVVASGYANERNVFALGAFELDMEKSFGSHFQVASALVFNDEGAELGVGFIDFHFFGGSVAARGRLFKEKGLHLQVGRFDVPFGNDWQYYASVDRVSVSAPLTTELVMEGGYNDVGLRLLRSNVTYNYSLFLLRGIEEGLSVGGRLGFSPFNNPYSLKKQEVQILELGFSYLHDMDRGGGREEKGIAFDFESQLGPVRFQGEWMRHDHDLTSRRVEGYHISAFLEGGEIEKQPFTIYGRYDYFEEKGFGNNVGNNVDSKLSRLTVGINLLLFDIARLKGEFLHFFNGNEIHKGSSFYAQLVITF